MTRPNSALAAVRALMDQQKLALLSGDLAALAPLPERLGQALHQLERAKPDAAALAELMQEAAHNARLLLSAQAGLARARQAIAPAQPLTTYDAQGRRQPDLAPGQLIARR